LTERTGDVANHAFALTSLGGIRFLLGDWDDAQTYLEKGRALVRSRAGSWFSSYPPLQVGRLDVARGNFDSASAKLEEALSIAREGNDWQPLILGTCFRAEMDLLRGDSDAALERTRAILDRDDLDQDQSTVTMAMAYAAWAHLECGNLEEAERLAQTAVSRLVEEHAIVELPMARRVAAMIAAARGDFEQADLAFGKIVTDARNIPYPFAEACALYEHGMMFLAQGNGEDARSRLEDALHIFQRLGARPYIDRTVAALAAVPPE
ncbi:MAG: hypothetical protein ACRDFS_13290, partial [Chloroflexota bacterium]